MYRYKRLMVPLSLGEQDEASIRYAAMISKLAGSDKIMFIHVAGGSDIPEDLQAEYPELVQPGDQSAKHGMEKLVSQYFNGYSGAQLEYEVVEGYPLIELLQRAKQDEIDLILMGKRREPRDGGTLPQKLVRKAPCSVLIIPEGAKSTLTSILVPTDFSENSVDAMDVGVAFAAAGGVSQIFCLHTYSVPAGFYKTGKSYEEFAEIMKGHAEKNYQKFLRIEICREETVCELRNLKEVTVSPIFKLEKKPAKAIEQMIKENQIDLLIMGARGRKAAAGVLLGSVTEHQIMRSSIPVLAVKRKGAGMSLLDALLKL
ncbi:MAG: universal stress protein [Desulfobacterales bacterium]|nr:universal stress protein [Desulfobacterales bacterium]